MSNTLFGAREHRSRPGWAADVAGPMNDPWYLLDTGLGPAAWNMAVDDVLLAQAASTARPVLRFYGWTESAATFGYSQRLAKVAALTHLRPLIRRPTGGGLVAHEADWTYSVTFPPDHEWYKLSAVASYQRMHEWLRRGFARCGVETHLAPDGNPTGPGQCFIGSEKNDLLLEDRKLAGAAQRRNRLGQLIQGSVQPPPRGLERSAWETALTLVGPGLPSRFDAWTLPASYIRASERLMAERYAAKSYNERR